MYFNSFLCKEDEVGGSNLVIRHLSFMWCVVRGKSKNEHQKDICESDWTTCSKFVNLSRNGCKRSICITGETRMIIS